MWKMMLTAVGVALLVVAVGCGNGGSESPERGIYAEYTGRYIVSQIDDGWVVTTRRVTWVFDELAYHMTATEPDDTGSGVCRMDGFYSLTDHMQLTPYATRLADGQPCDSTDLVFSPTGTFDFARLGDTIKLVQRDTLNGLVKELVLYR